MTESENEKNVLIVNNIFDLKLNFPILFDFEKESYGLKAISKEKDLFLICTGKNMDELLLDIYEDLIYLKTSIMLEKNKNLSIDAINQKIFLKGLFGVF